MKIIWTSITVACMGLAVSADEPAQKPDVSCELAGSYTGNAISPYFKLKLGPPGKPDWTYTSSDDMFRQLKDPRVAEYRGTYEIDGDLIVFTGELLTKRPAPAAGDQPHGLRFGLNFGFPSGKVAFNRFFPDAAGGFTYHRKWFRKEGKEWRPAEERRLTLPASPGEGAETWDVAWKGERVRWGADGTKAVEAVDVRLTYKRSHTDWYRPEKLPDGKWFWLPGDLILHRDKGEVVSVHESNASVGDLRGFHPGYAELAGGK
jgi:hypothetical protein